MEILTAIHDTGFATWVRESPSLFAFTGILFLHAVGLAFAVGVSAAIDLRILGVAPNLPLAPMEKLFPVIWVGFWINVLSGVPLLMANAEQDLINLTFYAKMLFIALAVVSVRMVRHQVFGDMATQPAVPTLVRSTADDPMLRSAPLRSRANPDLTAVAVLDPPVEILDATPAPTYSLPASLPRRARILAAASLFLWAAAIVAGRLCEYPSLLGLDYLR
jgi:hypothetical protein